MKIALARWSRISGTYRTATYMAAIAVLALAWYLKSGMVSW
jgi:hypothetical protein